MECDVCHADADENAIIRTALGSTCSDCLGKIADMIVKPWIVAKDELRTVRDKLLTRSDWTQVGDVSTTLKAQAAAERQKLRDAPSLSDDKIAAVLEEAGQSLRALGVLSYRS